MGKSENEELSFTDLLLVEVVFESKVAPYFELIKTFSPEQKAQALLQTNDYGSNALMIAARYCPSAVAPFLEVIKTFSPEQKAQVFLQCNNDGWNALMRAARYSPSAIAPLLEVIITLSLEQQAQVFLQCNKDGWNVVMIAAHYCPSAVMPFLDIMKTFSQEQQAQILLQIDNEGSNAVMIAVQTCPKTVLLLLEAIKMLCPEHQAQVMLQSCDDNWNALMFVARYYPSAVAPLLDIIKTLPLKKKAQALLQTNNDNWNVLMLVACCCDPIVVASLLEAIKTLSLEQQAQVFLQTNNDSLNVLMLVAIHQPSVLEPLLEAILSSPIEVAKKYDMVKKAYEHNSDMELPVMSAAIKMAWQNDIANILKRLKTYKNDAHEKLSLIEKKYIKILYNDLNGAFCELLKSNQTHKDFHCYRDAWIDDIYKVNSCVVLSKLPGVLKILDESLSIVLGVDNVYLMCEETNQVSKNRSLFFSSVLKGNKLTDVIAETSPVNC